MRPDSSIQWKAYPALLLAGCFALGIVVAAGQPEVPAWIWLLPGPAAFLAAGLTARRYRGRLVTPLPLAWTLAAGAAVLACGAASYAVRQGVPADHVGRVAGRSDRVVLEGRLLDAPAVRDYGLQLQVEAEQIVRGAEAAGVQGRVQVVVFNRRDETRGEATLACGDRIRLTGRLEPPPRRRNPADVDYGSYLRRQGIHATFAAYAAPEIVSVPAARSARCLVATARSYVRGQLVRFIPSPAARAVLTALLLGDRSAIDDATRDDFVRTGLMHLLAVSGLHVLLVGMVLYGLLQPFLLRLRFEWRPMQLTRTALTLGVLAAYAVLAGGSASVVRAVVMTGLWMTGFVLQRSAPSLNTLGAAALVLLVLQPEQLFGAGFQLSFAAVGGIVSLMPRLHELWPARWRARRLVDLAAANVTVSLAATLGTLPVLLYHFGHVSFAGLLLNIVAIPLTFLTLAAGLATLVAAPVAGVGGAAFGAAADAFAGALLRTAELGDSTLSWAAIHTYVDNPWTVATLVAVLAAMVQWPRPRHRWRLVAAALLCAAAGNWSQLLDRRSEAGLDVVFFDVGQGDAALVSTPGGRHLLIDAGLRDGYTDKGRRVVLPHLERYGIRRLDALVVTHPHSDHMGGVPAVLRSIPVGRVIHSGTPYASALYTETQALIDSLAIPYQPVQAGDTLEVDPDVRIHVLAPSEGMRREANVNEASVVLRVAYGATSFLFAGDAEAIAEEHLVRHYGALLRSDVVKVAHHGSETSSSRAFVARVTSQRDAAWRAVVSVAHRNRYGLPSADVLARWHGAGATVLTTASEGAIWLRSDGASVHHVRWR